MRQFILPALGYAGYPMILVGAIAVFGLSSLLTLDMIRAQVELSAAPAAASPDFNLPPVQQIGSITPPPVEVEPTAPKEPESSIVAVAPPEGTIAVTLTAPGASTSASVETGMLSGRIGGQAVNVRSGPSKTATTLGVLNAGSPVSIGEDVGGWIHVSFNGGDGWVYKTYLETSSITSIR
ncbi:MAG: SH3 domain-containing protein [Devosia sp.]